MLGEIPNVMAKVGAKNYWEQSVLPSSFLAKSTLSITKKM
jgi:hypothetical protein